MKFNFKDSTFDRFNFLIDIYDYDLIKKTNSEVVYKSDHMMIRILYCSYTSELTMNFKANFMNFKNEISFIDVSEYYHEIPTSYMANDQLSLDACLDKLSLFIQTKAVDLIKGNEFLFRKIYTFSQEENIKYNDELQMSFVRDKLALLWKQKKYSEIVQLLTPITDKLTSLELKKLDYAKKHS